MPFHRYLPVHSSWLFIESGSLQFELIVARGCLADMTDPIDMKCHLLLVACFGSLSILNQIDLDAFLWKHSALASIHPTRPATAISNDYEGVGYPVQTLFALSASVAFTAQSAQLAENSVKYTGAPACRYSQKRRAGEKTSTTRPASPISPESKRCRESQSLLTNRTALEQ